MPPSAPRSARVAVIDDDRFIRYLLGLHLRNVEQNLRLAPRLPDLKSVLNP